MEPIPFVSQIWTSDFHSKVCYCWIFPSPVQVILGEEGDGVDGQVSKAAYCRGDSGPGALISRNPHDPSVEATVIVGGWLLVFRKYGVRVWALSLDQMLRLAVMVETCSVGDHMIWLPSNLYIQEGVPGGGEETDPAPLFPADTHYCSYHDLLSQWFAAISGTPWRYSYNIGQVCMCHSIICFCIWHSPCIFTSSSLSACLSLCPTFPFSTNTSHIGSEPTPMTTFYWDYLWRKGPVSK